MSVAMDVDWKMVVEDICSERGRDHNALIPILQDIQLGYGCVPREAQVQVAMALDVPHARVGEVVSFYSFLTEELLGKYVFRLCRTISCEMAGKAEVAEALRSALGLDFGETSEDGLFSLDYTNCIGMCDQSPAMLVNDEAYGNLTPESVERIVADYREKGDELR
ncbi:MAG: NAD(P)H-dependent oxidoreductase subunit E [Clostridia bacterium]